MRECSLGLEVNQNKINVYIYVHQLARILKTCKSIYLWKMWKNVKQKNNLKKANQNAKKKQKNKNKKKQKNTKKRKTEKKQELD